MPAPPRLKVLFLPKWYPDRKQDLNGNFIQQHAQAVSGFADVIVLFANHDNFAGPDLVQFEFKKAGGIPTFYFYYKQHITGLPFLDKLLKIGLYFSCMFRGYRLIKRLYGRPDLLHVHVLLRTGLFAWLKQFTDGLPYIVTEHWTLYMPHNAFKISYLRRQLSRLVVAKAQAVHTVSENLKQAMLQLGLRNKRYAVIPNVVDTQTFSPQKHSVSEAKVQLLHVAIFKDAAKNLSGLLRALYQIARKRSDFQLKIIGFGPEEAAMKALAASLGLLNTFVFFEGKKETAEVAAYMQESDVLVLPSFYETFGVVLAEALACGIPVIATKVGGVPEVVGSPEHGILIEPGNAKALEEALVFLLDHHQDFDKATLRAYAESRFSYEAVGRQFIDLYKTVLNPDDKLADVR